MEEFFQIDADRIVGVAFDATEEEIRAAYHQKVKAGDISEIVHKSYELIKDQDAREKYLWNSIHSYFEKPPGLLSDSFDVEPVIAEIAFLSDWELGASYES